MTKNKQNIFRLIVAILVISALTLSANVAFGMSQVTLTVKNPDPYKGNHSWFIYEKEGGETIEDIASLKNFGTDPANVKIYAVDATSSESGSFILTFPDDEQKGIGKWAEVETKFLTINPGEILDIPFKIEIPDNITPGSYIGGLVVEDGVHEKTDGKTQKDCDESSICGTSVTVKTRIGSRIYLTVPGKTYEDFKLADFTASKGITGITKFKFRIENDGNVAYEPKAIIDVYDSLGSLYEHIEKPLGTSSPGTIVSPVVKMKKRPIIGNFTADAQVIFNRKFEPSAFHTASPAEKISIKFWVMPWEIIFTILIITLIITGLIIKQRSNRKKYMAPSINYKVEANEDIVSIAKERNISWKKIAKYNKLKPPYLVKEGDTLIVPERPKK